MERRKLRSRALLSSKYVLASPSTERLNDFEAEHSHPPPNTHARTPSQRPPLPFPNKAMGCRRGDLSPWQRVGVQTCVYEAWVQSWAKNWWWPSVSALYLGPLFPLSWFCYEHQARFYKQRGMGINILGTVGGDRCQHRQHSLKYRGRWCSVRQILAFFFLKISLKVSRLR